MKKIVFIIGTRPELIKVAPVYHAFKADPRWEALLISTGQHTTMLEQLYNFFDITPDIDLALMQPNQTLAGLSSLLFHKIDVELEKMAPDLVVVQGDTTTTMAGSLTAFYRKIPVAHIEAGLRTGNIWYPFPEEVNRLITAVIATYNFCPTQKACEHLVDEKRKNIYLVGNTVIDALLWARKKVGKKEDSYRQYFEQMIDPHKKIVLITAHRRESFGEGLKNIFLAIDKLADKYRDIQFIFPVHLNPNVQAQARDILGQKKNISLIAPLPYDKLIYLMDKCHLIMTDSGGIQEEAPTLKKPVLVLRNETERIEALEANLSKLVGTNIDNIISAFVDLIENDNLYRQMTASPNPYGDGRAAEKIKSIIDDEFLA